MPTDKTPASKPRPIGRPRSRPEGARARLIWLTDAESAAVKALIARLRKKRLPAG